MKITRKQIRKIILEYGENDSQLRKKIQNRDRMIGRGIDAGTIGFNPDWDYDKKPSSNNRLKRGKVGDELNQVVSRLEQHPLGEYTEVEPTTNPNKFFINSGDMKVKVENDYGTFIFSIVAPRKWKGKWKSEAESIDNEIDEVFNNLEDWIMATEEKEMDGDI